MSKKEDEVSELENEIEGLLGELTNLELQFEDLLKPKISVERQGKVDTNYLMAVRRFQNGMRLSLMNGAETGNPKTFLEGFKFYEGALTLLKVSGNNEDIQQCINELVQTLLKIVARANPNVDKEAPYGPFFLFKSCQYLANIYESSNDFELAMKFHDRAANFSTGIVRELEFLQKVLNALLINKIPVAQDTLKALQIKHIQSMGLLFSEGFTENNLQKIQNAQRLLETLAAQKNLSVTPILSLIEKLIEAVQPKLRVKGEIESIGNVIQIPAPSQALHLSDQLIDELRTVLKDGIQQLRSGTGSAQESPIIDTSSIISEIKNVISNEIKTISSEIVSQIINKLPVGLPSAPRAHSGGTISDDAPEIKIVGPAAGGERQQRPKLDDMIDSIIVSE